MKTISPIVKSASRVLNILEFIVNNPARYPTFTDLLNHLNIPKSSLSYLLQELVQQKYITLDTATKTYYPGVKLIRLSSVCLNTSNIFEVIWRGIKKLSNETGETCHAAVLNGRYVTYIAKVVGHDNMGLATMVGFRLPAHSTAVGLMLLSVLSEAQYTQLMRTSDLEKVTQYTVTDHDKILQELRQTAARGYAVERQQSTVGVCCVAGPVYDSTNEMVAAISLSFSANRSFADCLKKYSALVAKEAMEISCMLGYTSQQDDGMDPL